MPNDEQFLKYAWRITIAALVIAAVAITYAFLLSLN
jgi:hypothetical protein